MKPDKAENLEQLEILLLKKEYAALTASEKKELAGLFPSENAYNSMRHYLLNIKQAVPKELDELEPDPAIHTRLVNTLQLMPSDRKISHGSLLGTVLSIFAIKSLGLKSGLAAAMLAGMLWLGNQGDFSQPGTESITTPWYADTSGQTNHDSSAVRIDSAFNWQ